MSPQPKASPLLPLLLTITIFIQLLDATILNTALPAIAKDFHESPLVMQSTIISYALTLAIFIPLNSFLSDRIGLKKLFMGAMVVFVLGSIGCAMSPNLNWLLTGRVVQGIGGAMLAPAARTIIMRSYTRSQFFNVFNYASMPALLAPVLGPAIGGYLADYATWHWIFLINVPIGLGALILAWYILPLFPYKKSKLDLKGFFLFSGASFCLTLALELFDGNELVGLVVGLLIAGFAGVYFYWGHAKSEKDAIYSRDLFQIRTYRIGMAGNLVCRLGIGGVPYLLPLLFQIAYQDSASLSGMLLAPMALAGVAVKPGFKFILSRFGYRKTLIRNTQILGFLILLLGLPGKEASLWIYVPILIVLGGVNSLQFTAMNTITLSKLRDYQTTSANSMLSVNQLLSLGFGVAISAICLRIFNTDMIAHGDIFVAFRYSFIVIGLLTMISGAVFARLHVQDGKNMMG